MTSMAMTGEGKRNGARFMACLMAHTRTRRKVMPRGTWIQLVNRVARCDGSEKSNFTERMR